MSAVDLFRYQGEQVRTLVEGDDVLFVASDVAKILGYSATAAMTRRLDEEDKGVRDLHTLGGEQSMTVITEPGLYVAVLGSHVEGARAFKRWVTHEVLPAIRRTGTYTATPALPQTYAEALRELASTVEARAAAEARVAVLEPAAAAWDVMVSSSGDYSMDEAAKILSRDPSIEIGRTRLFTYLSEQGWIYRSGTRGRWHAYQSQVDSGRLVQRMSAAFLNARTGEMEAPAPTIRVTPKGLDALHRLLGGQSALVPMVGVSA